MEMSTKKRLDPEQLKELNIIMSLIDKYKSEVDSAQKNQLIKMLAVRHVITKGYLVKEVSEMIDESDIKFVKMVDGKIRNILTPIYLGLVDVATAHCKEWFLASQRKKGVTNPKIHKYQLDLIRWLLRAVICNELSEAIYTLLISRSSGKTYILSIAGFFLMLFHDRYILHNSFADYVAIATAPQQDQLASFQRYFHEFCELNTTNDMEIGLVAKNEKDESILGLYVKYKSMNRIEIVKQSGGNFSTIYFCLGAESIEGKHCS